MAKLPLPTFLVKNIRQPPKHVQKIATKLAGFLLIVFQQNLPQKFPQISLKIGRFSQNLTLKNLQNLTLSSATYQKPCICNTYDGESHYES